MPLLLNQQICCNLDRRILNFPERNGQGCQYKEGKPSDYDFCTERRRDVPLAARAVEKSVDLNVGIFIE